MLTRRKFMKIVFIVLAMTGFIVGNTAVGGRVALGDVYFNSSEPGCDGSNSNYLMCDDFEDGDWYSKDCDQANSSGGLLQTDGWCGTIFANPITPPGAAVCGNLGVNGTNCTATRGFYSGIGSKNNGIHKFANNVAVDEIYVRWYQKQLPGYVFGHEKILTLQAEGIWQCCMFMYPWGGTSVAPDLQNEGWPDERLAQNQGNALAVVPGRWYYYEIHIKLGTCSGTTCQNDGVYDLWMDDCGTNGLGCTGPGTLRAHWTGRPFRGSSSHHIREVWFNNWANPGSIGNNYLDQIIVATRRIGPMGVGTVSPPPPPPPPSPPTPPSMTPALSYAFDETSGATASDASGNGKTATLVNGPTRVPGKYGNGVRLDGVNDYLQVLSPSLPTGDFTWESWINPNLVSGFSNIMRAGSTAIIELNIVNGKIVVITNNVTRITSAASISTGTWTHVSITRRGSTLTAYVNGNPTGTGSDAAAYSFSTCQLLIGVDSDTGCTGTPNGYFNGTIDEIRIYNRALSQAEILNDMNTPIGGVVSVPDAPSVLTLQ